MANFVIGVIGDSQAGLNFKQGASISPTNPNEWWNGSAFADNIGEGQIAMANEIVALSGGIDTVQIINSAINAGSMTIAGGDVDKAWEDEFFTSGKPLFNFNAAVTAAKAAGSANPDIIYMYVGGVDAVSGISSNAFLDALSVMRSFLEVIFPNDPDVILSPLARFEGGTATDDEWNAINSAIRRAADFFPWVHSTADLTDLVLKDGQHISNSISGATGFLGETIKQGTRVGRTIARVLGIGSPPVNVSPQIIRIEQQTTTSVLIGLDQDVSFSGLLGSLEFSDDDWLTSVFPTSTRVKGSTIECIVPSLSISAEIKCRNNYGPNDYDPATSTTAFNSGGLPIAWADARTRLFIGMHFQDPSVGNLSTTATTATDRALAVPQERINLENGERRAIGLGVNASGTAANAILFLVESDTADFTGEEEVVAEITSFDVSALQVYEDNITPYNMIDGKYYGAVAMNGDLATAYDISKSDMSENGDLDFTLNIDATDVTDGIVPATYQRTSTAADFGLVIWTEIEYISSLVFGSSSVRKLYRHSMPLTGRGMDGKHTSPLIKVRK